MCWNLKNIKNNNSFIHINKMYISLYMHRIFLYTYIYRLLSIKFTDT